MSDAEWLAEVHEEAGPCPRCGALAAKPIIRGMPTYDAVEQLGDRVSFGGCVVTGDDPAYECGACGQAYGLVRRERSDFEDDEP